MENQSKYMATLMEMWESDWASEMDYAREEGLKQRNRRTESSNGIEQRNRTTEKSKGKIIKE